MSKEPFIESTASVNVWQVDHKATFEFYLALFSKESFRRAVKTLTAPDCEQENVFRQEVQTPGSVSLCEGVLGLQQLHLTRVP